MNFVENYDIILKALPDIYFTYKYVGGDNNLSYEASDLHKLRYAINLIEDLPYISESAKILKNSWLFESNLNKQKINTEQANMVQGLIYPIKVKLETFKEIAETSTLFNRTDTILIRIPEIESFENLQKYAGDFKKAIEIPILDKNIEGTVKIPSAAEGSIILNVALGTIAAVKLVAGICWSAAVLKKKRAEAKMFEQHARTLELKNDALTSLVDAQKAQLKNILDSEANALANKEYNHNEPETIERLKLSISTVAELIDKGVQILPISKEENIQKSFPDYKNLNLIESTIKQIAPN